MKLLIVAMSESIHTARWLAQIEDQGWEIHLFPSIDCGYVHPEISKITVYHSFYDGGGVNNKNVVKSRGCRLYHRSMARIARKILNKFFPAYRVFQLSRLIKKIRPDIIHTFEMQQAAYLTLEAKERTIEEFPLWIVTIWGSDLYLFGRLADHEPKIRAVLEASDYFSCECKRDVELAKKYGFKGKFLPVFPVTGGFDLERFSSLRQTGKISARRLILLKGYQTWAGRALVGLRALECCADILTGYEVAIYLGGSIDIAIAAELFSKSTGIPITIIPRKPSNNDILRLHGQARISIGLSISDGLPVSFLEAIAMGSFPIQSWTSCVDELVVDGKDAILVPPEDPNVVEVAIRRALTDDELVDRAAEENWKLCNKKLNKHLLKSKAIELYLTVSQNKDI